jgi:hypothetical protein
MFADIAIIIDYYIKSKQEFNLKKNFFFLSISI